MGTVTSVPQKHRCGWNSLIAGGTLVTVPIYLPGELLQSISFGDLEKSAVFSNMDRFSVHGKLLVLLNAKKARKAAQWNLVGYEFRA